MKKSRLWNSQYVIGFLGLLAVATGVAAELTRNKDSDVSYEEGGCSLPSSPALALGTTAALSLLLAQLTANAIGGCVCWARDLHNIPTCNRLTAMILLLFSWMTFAIAIYLFVAGSSMNERQPHNKPWLDNDCYVVKPGVFSWAAALSFLTVILDFLFYIAITAKRTEDLPITSSVMPVAVPSARNSENFSNPQHVPVFAGNVEFNGVVGSNPDKHEL